MEKLIVSAKKLNKRSIIPSILPDSNNIAGEVFQKYTFNGIEIKPVPNPALGKWFQDQDGYFYWGGGLNIVGPAGDDTNQLIQPAVVFPVQTNVTTSIKTKIEEVVNAFETDSVTGNYAGLVKNRDYYDPITKTTIVQISYGRSQTTEFGNLKNLVQDYVDAQGMYAVQLKPYLGKIGNKPSLSTNAIFCMALIDAGKKDTIMRICQDSFFDKKYYEPAFSWFTENGFTTNLSLLVIYDSWIQSGQILHFLTQKFLTKTPIMNGDEKEWIINYVEVRQNWLAASSNILLRNTVYRTECFHQQILNGNWNLKQKIMANAVIVA